MVVLQQYFDKQHLHKPAINLFRHHFFRLTATALLGIFGPIYLYEIFGEVTTVLWYALGAFGLVSISQPLMMKCINKIGFKRSMIIAQMILALLYGLWYVLGKSTPAEWLVLVAAVVHGFVIVLYWVPYHTDFALLTEGRSRGKNLALLTGLIAITSIITPTISSWIISYAGFGWLFTIILVLLCISTLFLREIPEITERYSYGYWQTYRELFKKKNRKMFLAYAADGAQSMIGANIWPLFIFFILDNNFLSVGIVTSLVVLVSVIVRLVFGNYADKMSKSKLAKGSSLLYALGWVFKSFVGTPFEVFAAGSYHNLTGSAARISIDSLMYERAASSGHYIDEYSVLREVALSLGRVMMLTAAIALLYFVDMAVLFWIAAVASLFIGLL